MAARHAEGCYENNIPQTFFLVFKGLSDDDLGAARGAVLQEIRPGAGFKTGDFVEEKLGALLQNDSDNVFLPLDIVQCAGFIQNIRATVQ